MILLVDVGNTRIKWAFLDGSEFVEGAAERYTEETLAEVLKAQWGDLPVLDHMVVSNVASKKVASQIRRWAKAHHDTACYFLAPQKQFESLKNGYQKVRELGIDRWMSLVAAYQTYKKPFVVFDCGTAITADAVDVNGQHIGGLILPGLELMQQSLQQGTEGCHADKSPQKTPSSLLANNTHQAISGGGLYAAAAFIERLVDELRQALGQHLTCVITGGDAPTLLPLLQTSMKYEPHLVLQGLAIRVEVNQKKVSETVEEGDE